MTLHRDAALFTKLANPWYKDPMVMGAVAAPVVGAAVQGGALGIRKLWETRQKARSYKSMLATNKHLRGKPARETQQLFNTLWTLNPTLAKDPLTSGAFVYEQLASSDPTFPHRGILAGAQAVSGINANISKSRRIMPDFGSHASKIVAGIGDAMGRRSDLVQREEGISVREKALKAQEAGAREARARKRELEEIRKAKEHDERLLKALRAEAKKVKRSSLSLREYLLR